jgi:hypothetical protein
MPCHKALIDFLRAPERVRHLLGDAVREVELLRWLLRLATSADRYQQMDRHYHLAKR